MTSIYKAKKLYGGFVLNICEKQLQENLASSEIRVKSRAWRLS